MTDSSSPAQTIPASVVDAFDDAQRRTIAIAGAIARELTEGVSEREVARRLTQRCLDDGFSSWFHKPHVRFDAPVHPRRSNDSHRRLRVGQVVELDLAPAHDTAFADFAISFVFGDAPDDRLVDDARDLCRASCGYASRWKCTGEIFVYAQAWATNRGLSIHGSSIGHDCFPPDSAYGGVWPKLARAATLLRRNQIQWFNPRRMHGLYSVQPRLVAGSRACGFEEMVLIDGDTQRVLGRDGLDAIGTL